MLLVNFIIIFVIHKLPVLFKSPELQNTFKEYNRLLFLKKKIISFFHNKK